MVKFAKVFLENSIEMRGRKQTPTALKRLNGNPGKRPLPSNEPQPPAAAADDVPHELEGHEHAAREYSRLAPILAGVRCLTEADRKSLAYYCLCYENWLLAVKAVEEHGLFQNDRFGMPKVNPAFQIQNEMLSQIRWLTGEFGLSPASRARISVPDQGKDAKPSGMLSLIANAKDR